MNRNSAENYLPHNLSQILQVPLKLPNDVSLLAERLLEDVYYEAATAHTYTISTEIRLLNTIPLRGTDRDNFRRLILHYFLSYN